jgi:predicted signal transduction protein with EAL and GGDEF domain
VGVEAGAAGDLGHAAVQQARHVVVEQQAAARAVVVEHVAEAERTLGQAGTSEAVAGSIGQDPGSSTRIRRLTNGDGDYYRLRTEWLRFKSHLRDGLTGLPALPAVLEEVRRMVESHGAVELVYLDLGRSGWHETKLGWAAYDESIRSFAKRLLSLRGGALTREDVLCLHTVRSDRFLIFRGANGEAGDPAEAASTLRARLLQALSASTSEEPLPHSARIATGHAHVRQDPMTRAERAIQQAVTDAMMMSLHQREGIESARRAELQRLIDERRVRSVFHPIVQIADRKVVGHEALTRPVGAHTFDSVEELFAFAERTDLLEAFERLCRSTAIRTAAAHPERGLLFLNASARAVEDPEWANGAVEALLAKSGLSPRDVVVEITERLAVTHIDTSAACCARSRRAATG